MIGPLSLGGKPHLLAMSFWPRTPFQQHPNCGIAFIAVLWAYERWHVLSFAAGEFKHVQPNLPRGLFYGTLIVAVTYRLANAG